MAAKYLDATGLTYLGSKVLQLSKGKTQTVANEVDFSDIIKVGNLSSYYLVANGTSIAAKSGSGTNTLNINYSGGNVQMHTAENPAKFTQFGATELHGTINAVNNTITNVGGLELSPSTATANHGGYIDFHYNRSAADYTSRIIQNVSGNLSINGQLNASSTKTAITGDLEVKTLNKKIILGGFQGLIESDGSITWTII